MKNVEATILSQYANSPTLLQLIHNFNECIDPHKDIDAFYNNIWNIKTATGYGLDVWGRIVNVPRLITVSSQTYFGFQDGTGDQLPFGQAPFYSGPAASQNYPLSDDAYRVLILVKAMTNIAATNIPTLRTIFLSLFSDRGRCYINDLGNMRMRYTFEFMLQPFELAILTQSGALAHPTGVAVAVFQVPVPGTFGFAEAGISAQPFGSGTFLPQGEIYAI